MPVRTVCKNGTFPPTYVGEDGAVVTIDYIVPEYTDDDEGVLYLIVNEFRRRYVGVIRRRRDFRTHRNRDGDGDELELNDSDDQDSRRCA
jgi:hypothetical protein